MFSRAAATTPVPDSKASSKLADQDFALYVNGRRVAAEVVLDERPGGIELVVSFKTSRGALTDPRVDPKAEVAWAGWKAGDTCRVFQPIPGRKFPSNGYVEILAIEPPAQAGAPTYFVCKALTPVYDWRNDGNTVCSATERVKLPASWFVR
jgi:hypothetical protein